MRALVIALAVLAACRISGAHFTGDDGGDDGHGGGSDASYMDAPPQAMRYAFLVDSVKGVYEMTKGGDGSLQVGTLQSIANPVQTVIDSGGQDLYLARFSNLGSDVGAVLHYTINGGHLTAGVERTLGVCGPVRMAIPANGNYVVVGCNSTSATKGFAVVTLSNHEPINAMVYGLASIEPGTPILSSDDRCLYLADNKIGGGGNNIFAYSITADGHPTYVGGFAGPDAAFAMTVDTNSLYVAGKGISRFAIQSDCSLGPSSAIAFPNAQKAIVRSPSHLLYSGGTSVNVAVPSPLGSLFTMQLALGGTDAYVTTTIDPGTPQILYLTAKSLGTEVATINTDGSVNHGSVYAPAQSADPVWFQLAP